MLDNCQWCIYSSCTQVYGEKVGDTNYCQSLPGTDLGVPTQQENCYFDRITGKKLATKGSLEFTSLTDAAKACLPGENFAITSCMNKYAIILDICT